MIRLIAFLLLSLFATYMESSASFKKKPLKSNDVKIPISNQLLA